MSDRVRLDDTRVNRVADGSANGPAGTDGSGGFRSASTPGLPDLLQAVFQKVSNTIAGGDEGRLEPLLETDAEAANFLPDDAVDPDTFDESTAEEFTPDLPSITDVDVGQAPGFNLGDVPAASEGRFLRTPDGKMRYTVGVGEAPDNRANRNHPVYRQRAEFVSGMLEYVTSTFSASSAGQWRALDAPVTSQRSHNSDHYSGGAFDVRASSQAEAQRILAWASQQPWVSFAQVYPPDGTDGILIHISANIGMFGGETPTSIVPRETSSRPAPVPSRPAPVPEPEPEVEGSSPRANLRP